MRRFPFGLTAAALIGFGILIGLGAWQLQRLAWKQRLLAQVEALRGAPPLTIAQAMAPDMDFTRVAVRCAAPRSPSPVTYRYALRNGAVGWRLLTPCHLAGAPNEYDGVILDRGLVARFTGSMAPGIATFAEPASVIGILRPLGAKPLLGVDAPTPPGGVVALRVIDLAALVSIALRSGLHQPMPYILAVESESPPLSGVTPAALPEDIPNNHFVYALTWFALAGILAWFYGALLWRRLVKP